MTGFVDPATFMADHDKDPMPRAYREFRDGEGIPVHTGLYVRDLNELATGPWDRTGQAGAFINLVGMEGIDDLQLHDLEPGGETTTQHHIYQEIVYVLGGSGLTVLGTGDDRTVFEWDEHALFVIPRNTPYKHVNLSEGSTTRLVAQTDLPELIALTEDERFVFSPNYDFWAAFGADDQYDAEGTTGTMYEHKYEGDDVPITWEANFVPSVRAFDELDTEEWSNLGAMKILRIPFPHSNTHAHISEIPVGQYKNAHRHGPGANVFIESGEGYTLIWKPGADEKIKLDWGPRSVFTPPAGWYHHHFNLGREPAKQFAMHAPPLGTLDDRSVFDSHMDENIIDYAEEDPEIRELYQAELDARGREFRMPEACYTDPDYSFAV